jgi:hypothetical protein
MYFRFFFAYLSYLRRPLIVNFSTRFFEGSLPARKSRQKTLSALPP